MNTQQLLRLRIKIDRQLGKFFDGKIKQAAPLPSFVGRAIGEIKNFALRDGKRFRPILFYFGYIAAGGKSREAALRSSIFIELIHDAILIHDDIIDRDTLRRGKPTMHERFKTLYRGKTADAGQVGVSFGIMAGDMLLGYGYEALVSSKFSPVAKEGALKKLGSVLSYAATGEELDILYSARPKAGLRDILRVYEYKTARYTIEGPLHLGAILAGADEEFLKKLSRFAIPLGIVFQIQDDILGMFGDEKTTGKSASSDLKQGKQTILIFEARRRANKKQRRIIDRVLGNRNLTNHQTEEIRKIIRETKSLEYAEKLARKLVDRSKAAIKKSFLPRAAEDFLMRLADYVVSRKA